VQAAEIMSVWIRHVWIAGLAGIRGVAQQSRVLAGLCRPVQALEAQSGGDRVGLRGASLVERGTGGAEERAQE
jgi:hypothetical protein